MNQDCVVKKMLLFIDRGNRAYNSVIIRQDVQLHFITVDFEFRQVITDQILNLTCSLNW